MAKESVMLILLEKQATEQQVRQVLTAVTGLGHKFHLSPMEQSLLVSVDNKTELDIERFKKLEGVKKVLPLQVELPKPI